jgi:hypothetical protein
MTQYRIEQEPTAVVIEVSDLQGNEDELLRAFGECQPGTCSCPTSEYEKVATTTVEADEKQITVRLEPKPGQDLDRQQVATCLDHALNENGSSA